MGCVLLVFVGWVWFGLLFGFVAWLLFGGLGIVCRLLICLLWGLLALAVLLVCDLAFGLGYRVGLLLMVASLCLVFIMMLCFNAV